MTEKKDEGPRRTLAVSTYEAYGQVTDFKNFRGEPMPIFEELPEQIQEAWKTATEHAMAFGALQRAVEISPAWDFNGVVDRVVDGDTLDLIVDLGFKIYHRIRVRLLGVDTPEVYGVKKGSPEYMDGLVASDMTKAWVSSHAGPDGELVIRTHQETGKYGRWLAEIVDASGNSLNEALIEAGYGSEKS